MKIKYNSNNSGGRWWLKDDDWRALEAAGWTVNWCKDDPRRAYGGGLDADGVRWLGALAKNAEKDFETPAEAMQEFALVTGQNVSDEGLHVLRRTA